MVLCNICKYEVPVQQVIALESFCLSLAKTRHSCFGQAKVELEAGCVASWLYLQKVSQAGSFCIMPGFPQTCLHQLTRQALQLPLAQLGGIASDATWRSGQPWHVCFGSMLEGVARQAAILLTTAHSVCVARPARRPQHPLTLGTAEGDAQSSLRGQ